MADKNEGKTHSTDSVKMTFPADGTKIKPKDTIDIKGTGKSKFLEKGVKKTVGRVHGKRLISKGVAEAA